VVYVGVRDQDYVHLRHGDAEAAETVYYVIKEMKMAGSMRMFFLPAIRKVFALLALGFRHIKA